MPRNSKQLRNNMPMLFAAFAAGYIARDIGLFDEEIMKEGMRLLKLRPKDGKTRTTDSTSHKI